MTKTGKFWVNGYWPETFEAAILQATVGGQDSISYSADGTPEALTNYATLAADGTWWIIQKTADAAVTCFEMAA